MQTELSFKEACNVLKKTKYDAKFLENVDQLITLGMILSPFVIASLPVAGFTALSLLGAKSELFKIGKAVCDKVLTTEDDILQRLTRMEVAHTLTCYSAFFEAVDRTFPKIFDTFGLDPKTKFEVSSDALARLTNVTAKPEAQHSVQDNSVLDRPIPLPHPVDGFADHLTILQQLYQDMAKGFINFLGCLTCWMETSEQKREKFVKDLEQLPVLAVRCYRAQYFKLCTQFNEFYIWANLQDVEGTKTTLAKLQKEVRKQIEYSIEQKNTLDVGLARLSEIFRRLPEQKLSPV